MSTAIVTSPYESMVVDYLQEIEGYLCKTGVQFLLQKSDKRGRKRNVRCDIDILAFNPKRKKFLFVRLSVIPLQTKKIKKWSNGGLESFRVKT